jgi:hypothetical protein
MTRTRTAGAHLSLELAQAQMTLHGMRAQLREARREREERLEERNLMEAADGDNRS